MTLRVHLVRVAFHETIARSCSAFPCCSRRTRAAVIGSFLLSMMASGMVWPHEVVVPPDFSEWTAEQLRQFFVEAALCLATTIFIWDVDAEFLM